MLLRLAFPLVLLGHAALLRLNGRMPAVARPARGDEVVLLVGAAILGVDDVVDLQGTGQSKADVVEPEVAVATELPVPLDDLLSCAFGDAPRALASASLRPGHRVAPTFHWPRS